MKIKHTIFLIFLLGLVVGAYAFTQSRKESDSTEVMENEESVVEDTDTDSDADAGDSLDSESGDADAEKEASDPTSISPTDPDADAAMVGYALDMSPFKFNPNLIEAEPGQKVTVKLTNSQGTHNFNIDELGVKSSTISSGGEDTVVINIPANAVPGDYEFYCGIGNHRQLGMVGILRIAEK